MNHARPSSLAAVLLTPDAGPRAPRRERDAEAAPAPTKAVTIFVGAATLGECGPFRARGASGAVALLAFGDARRAVGEYLDGATASEASITAAALGLERLRHPCRVRLVTDAPFLVHTMTGEVRRVGHFSEFARLDRALVRGGHQVEWHTPETGSDHGAIAACHETAAEVAARQTADDDVLNGCPPKAERERPAPTRPDPPRYAEEEVEEEGVPARRGRLAAIGRDIVRAVASLTRSVGRKQGEAG